MSHWARINSENVVDKVLVGDNSLPDEGASLIHKYFGGVWIKTSINTWGGIYYTTELDENNEKIPAADQSKALRKNYAGIGFTYDAERDAFIPPKPFESWVLDEETCLWKAPIEKPLGADYVWNEEAQSWDEVLWDEEV